MSTHQCLLIYQAAIGVKIIARGRTNPMGRRDGQIARSSDAKSQHDDLGVNSALDPR